MTPTPPAAPTATRSEHHDGLLRELSEVECWAHLRDRRVGRVAYVVDGGPVILPFNYLVQDGRLWLRTASYTELALHLPGRRAAFAVDHADERTRTGWSVLVRGRAEHVVGDHPVVPDGALDPAPWPEGPRRMVLCLTPDEVSGRALTRSGVAPVAGHGPGTIQRSPAPTRR